MLERDQGPKVKGQPEDVDVGTILAITGIFVVVIQARFEEPGLPWRWRSVFHRDDAQEATPEAPDPIYVVSAFAVEPDVRSVLPRVVVGVTGAALNQVVVGNRANIRVQDRTEVFYAHDAIPVQIRCYGRTPGESLTIGDLVRKQVAMGRNQIREAFNLHDVTLPSLTAPDVTKEVEGQADQFMSVVSFQVTNEVRWTTRPLAPLLQEIRLLMRRGGREAEEVSLYGFTR